MTDRRVALVAVLMVVSSLAAADDDVVRLSLVATSGTGGRLERADGTTAAALAAHLHGISREVVAAGRAPLVVDLGRTLGPWAESRREGGRTILEVLAAGGCAAFFPDALDLSLSSDLWGRHRAVSGLEIVRPFAVTDDASLDPSVRLEAGGLMIELSATLAPDRLDDLEVGGHRARPWREGEPWSADAVDLRVLVVHSDGHGADLTSRRLTWQLVEAPGRADLLLDPDLGHDLTVRRTGTSGPVALAGRDRDAADPWTVWRVDVDVARGANGWEVVRLATLDLPVPEGLTGPVELERRVRARMEDFRSELAAPLPAAAPSQREDLERFVLEALREAAEAEVALLNRGALRPVAARHFDSDRLRREAVVRLLSLDQSVTRVGLSGSDLRTVVAQSAARTGPDGAPRSDSLATAGLEWTLGADGTVDELRVNGRPVREKDIYRVATTGYLLAGGDDFPTLAAAASDPVGPEAAGLELRRDVVMPRLERADEPFADLESQPLWRWGADRIGLGLDGVVVDRDPSYADATDSRASAEDSTTLQGDLRLYLSRSLPAWRWENLLVGRLSLLETAGDLQEEIADDLRLDSSVVFSGTPLLGGAPYLGVIVDTELRRDQTDAGVRLPRQLEESVTAGLTWELERWPRVRVGGVARRYAHDDRANQYGVLGEALYRWAPEDRIGVDGRVLAEWVSGGGDRTRRLDLDVRLLIPAWGQLAFAPGVNWYHYDEAERPGRATSLRYFLSLTWSGHGRAQLR